MALEDISKALSPRDCGNPARGVVATKVSPTVLRDQVPNEAGSAGNVSVDRRQA
jgi:hypothetical protein